MSVLIERIRERMIEEGDCWIWQGRTSDSGLPRMNYGGRRDAMVRRLIAEERRPIPKGWVASPRCGNPMCVNPEHVIVVTIKQARERAAKRGAYQNQRRVMLAAETNRARSHITEEMVAQIKAAPSSPAASRLTGVSVGHAWSIRAGHARRDYRNPFEGLMR